MAARSAVSRCCQVVHRTGEQGDASGDVDGHVPRVEIRIPVECLDDAVPDVPCRRPRSDLDVIEDPPDAFDMTDRFFGTPCLIEPAGPAGQSEMSVVHGDLDGFRNGPAQLEGAHGIAGNVGVGASDFSRTWRSFATPFTPRTRLAARSAASFPA